MGDKERYNEIKIVYYGNFTTPHQTEYYIADALQRCGFNVMKINRDKTHTVDCDYMLFAKLRKNDVILKYKELGIPTISWTFDLYRGFKVYERYNDHHLEADIIITTDGDDGYPTIRQGIHKPEKVMIKGTKVYNIVFVGSAYYKERKELLQRVKPKIFQGIRGFGLNKLFGQTKIVLGDSYPATNYWSNRVYETMGRGGFLIHPKVEGLPSYIPQFERGKEKEVIEYYLKNEKEREELRELQFKMCPTYDDRIKELIEICHIK